MSRSASPIDHGQDVEPIGDRIEDLAELRRLVEGSGEIAVEVVGEPRHHQDDERPAVVLRDQHQPQEQRHAEEPSNAEDVRQGEDAVGDDNRPLSHTSLPSQVLVGCSRSQPTQNLNACSGVRCLAHSRRVRELPTAARCASGPGRLPSEWSRRAVRAVRQRAVGTSRRADPPLRPLPWPGAGRLSAGGRGPPILGPPSEAHRPIRRSSTPARPPPAASATDAPSAAIVRIDQIGGRWLNGDGRRRTAGHRLGRSSMLSHGGELTGYLSAPVQARDPERDAHRNLTATPSKLSARHEIIDHVDDQRAEPSHQCRPLKHADGSPVRVLVVDDEPNIAELLAMALRLEGWEISIAHSGSAALTAAKKVQPDAVVLDIMLPDFDGMEVMRRLRSHSPDVPVLFLTAKDAVEDRVAGLTAGGDDYVTKPFSLEEVVARLRALLRRTGVGESEPSSQLVVGDLILDEDSHEVSRAGTAINLTATEFELLRYLMRNPRRVLSKAQILDRVWNYDFGGQANVVELYISYLRKKIDAGRTPMIHTMRGAGYVIKPAD